MYHLRLQWRLKDCCWSTFQVFSSCDCPAAEWSSADAGKRKPTAGKVRREVRNGSGNRQIAMAAARHVMILQCRDSVVVEWNGLSGLHCARNNSCSMYTRLLKADKMSHYLPEQVDCAEQGEMYFLKMQIEAICVCMSRIVCIRPYRQLSFYKHWQNVAEIIHLTPWMVLKSKITIMSLRMMVSGAIPTGWIVFFLTTCMHIWLLF